MGKVIRRGRKHCSLAGYISCPIPLPTGHPPSPTHTHQLKESSWAFGNNNTQNRNFHRFHKSLQIFKRRNNRVLLIASSLSWNTEWSRAKANRILPRERTGHSKHPLPTTQEKTLHMEITRWSTPKSDWLYSLQPKMETLYTVSKNKTGSWLWPRSWAPYGQIQTEIEESRENH